VFLLPLTNPGWSFDGHFACGVTLCGRGVSPRVLIRRWQRNGGLDDSRVAGPPIACPHSVRLQKAAEREKAGVDPDCAKTCTDQKPLESRPLGPRRSSTADWGVDTCLLTVVSAATVKTICCPEGRVMLCSKYSHENRRGAKFCEEVRRTVDRACANCGSQLSPTAKFCPECAQPTGLVRDAQASARFASPQGYTPKHLAEKILTSKTALEGERKQVTVLFADVRGSMELLADHDPEEARKLRFLST